MTQEAETPQEPTAAAVPTPEPKTGAELVAQFMARKSGVVTDAKGNRSTEISGTELAVYASGFQALKEKRLPNGRSEGIVALLYECIRSSYTAYSGAIAKLDAELEDVELLDDNEEKIARLVEARKRRRELDAMMFPVTVPALKLTRHNLPRVHKGKEGDMNPAQNASIIVSLTPLFMDPMTKEELDKIGTEE